MDLSASWIDVETPAPSNSMVSESPDCCPLPVFVPRFDPPPHQQIVAASVSGMQTALRDAGAKAELHRVLQAVQCSRDFGIYFCESFRDPRRHYIDDYWHEVSQEAMGVEELHRVVGKADSPEPLSDEARTRFHQLARLFDRLARRIDRVVLAP